MSIDRNSPLPLYYQLKQHIAEQIAAGVWKPGDMLPTEQQLQDEYQLSRTTVRTAFRELEIEGAVIRQRGLGTFVAEPKLAHSPEPHFSMTNHLIQRGIHPGWKVLSAGWVPAPPEVAARLQLKPETEVFQLRRLRLADNAPIGYHIAYVSPAFKETIDSDAFTEGGSMRYLRRQDHLEGSQADRIIQAMLAEEEEADLLNISEGDAVLLIRRLTFSKSGQPIEDFRGLYRGDRFQYIINKSGLSIRPR